MKNKPQYAQQLNSLLASYQLHYQNLRSLHWNIKGPHFFELHLKYEELYSRVQLIIDEIAERILTLEIQPLSSYSGYLNESKIKEIPVLKDGKSGIEYVLSAQKTLLTQEKKLLELSSELDDEGTNSFMSDLMREKEKTNWMLKSWLNQ